MTHVPTIIFVESNTSGTGADFVRQAEAMGLAVVFVARDPKRYTFLERSACQVVQVNTADFQSTLSAIRSLPSATSLVGIWSSSEYFIHLSSCLAHSLSLPAPDSNAIQICRDKYMLRQRLRNGGLDQVRSWIVFDPEEACRRFNRTDGRAVIKPRQGSGSVGVSLCTSEDQARSHSAELFATQPDASRCGLLLEPYLEGTEYSVEIFDSRPVCIVKKKMGELPYFVETGHDLPADISSATANQITTFAALVSASLGLSWGPAHLELKVTETGTVHLIEVNPRLAGGYIPTAIHLAGGPDLIEQTIRRAIGERIPDATYDFVPTAIRFMTVALAQRLPTATLKTLLGHPGIVHAKTYSRAEATTKPHNDFRDRIGHVIAQGKSSQEAGCRAEHALDQLWALTCKGGQSSRDDPTSIAPISMTKGSQSRQLL